MNDMDKLELGYGDMPYTDSDLTDEEYEDMVQFMDDVYGDTIITSEELDCMFVEDVRKKLESGNFKYSMNDWIYLNDVVESVGRIKKSEISTSLLNGVNDDFAYILDRIGYKSEIHYSPHLYVQKQGKLAAKLEGRNWEESLDGHYDVPPTETVIVDNIKDVPFYEMVFYRANKKEPWTNNDTALLNSKIVESWENMNKSKERDIVENDMMLSNYDLVVEKRRSDGIMGNEPDIPYFEASERLFGKSYLEVKEDHDREAKNIKSLYDGLSDSLFNKVYETSMICFDVLPEVTRNGLPSDFSVVTRDTYNILGSEYRNYRINRNLDNSYRTSYKKASLGVDFSRSVLDTYIPLKPVSERTKMYQNSLIQERNEKKFRKLPDGISNQICGGRSNSDYDFDEYE